MEGHTVLWMFKGEKERGRDCKPASTAKYFLSNILSITKDNEMCQ